MHSFCLQDLQQGELLRMHTGTFLFYCSYCFCFFKNWVMASCLGPAAALAFLPAPKVT